MSILVALIVSLPGLAAANDQLYVWLPDQGLLDASHCEVLKQSGEFNPSVVEIRPASGEFKDSYWKAAGHESAREFIRCAGHSSDFMIFNVETKDGARARVGLDVLDMHQSVERLKGVERSFTDGIVGVSSGTLDYVVCVTSSALNVRDESLAKVLFTVNRHDPVKPSQSWEENKKQKVIGGTTYTFIKAEFPSKSGANVGWVADEFVKLKSECGGVPPVTNPPGDGASGWTFPTIKRPTDSYKVGMTRFKANRGGGKRWHAACDLYRQVNEAAVSAASGTVIRDRYYFYQGTYAIEVRHTGGRVARYGEITGKAAPGIGAGRKVGVGQTIGYIGKVNSNCCKPMLHFELYAGTATGPLSQSGNKFQRRKDLMDPTALLSGWEKAKFGASW